MRHLLMLALVGGLLPTLAVAEDWTRFRGPNGTGVSPDATVPTSWTKTKNIAWKTEIPGIGHSSPIISKGKVFLQSSSADGKERMLVCLSEAKGTIDWVKTVPAEPSHIHPKNSLASGTAAADANRVYVVFWTGRKVIAAAYDYTGNPLWQYELGGYISQHGAAIAPVVYGNNVYLNYDQDGAAELVCLDATTGKKKWSAERKPERACYTPVLVHPLANGQSEIIATSTTCLSGYDAETGKLRWNWDWVFQGKKLRTVAVPLLAGDTLIQFSGDGGGSRSAVALDLSSESPKLSWELLRDTPYVPAGVIAGKHLYLVTDAGFAVCIDVKTGKKLWNERVFTKAVSSSAVLIGDTVLCIAEDGKAVAFKAQPEEFEKLSESNVGETVFASPAVANGKLFIRGAKSLFAIGAK